VEPSQRATGFISESPGHRRFNSPRSLRTEGGVFLPEGAEYLPKKVGLGVRFFPPSLFVTLLVENRMTGPYLFSAGVFLAMSGAPLVGFSSGGEISS